MAIRAQEPMEILDDDLPVRFLTALPDHPHKEHRTYFEDVRTCTHCGRTASFHDAGPGGWATCSACGALA